MSSDKPEAYNSLVDRFREIGYLTSTSSLLGWDQETYMPEKAVAYRAKQGAYFSGQIHALATAEEVGGWISNCEDHGFPDGSVEAANVREWRHDYERSTRLSSGLVTEFKEQSSLALAAWQKARAESDFSHFAPHLEKLVELSILKADAWGYDGVRYDALLESYERGAKTAEIESVFDDLKPKVVEIVRQATEKAETTPADILQGHYPIPQQQAFNREVAEAVGFDFSAGRIDTAPHPFCSGMAPGDTRLTTRYMEDNFTSSLFGVLHEAGHGLYDQGLPGDRHGTPCGEAVSLGIHESQSRLWENHIGRSRAFWERWLPRAAHYFPHLAKLDVDQMTSAVNRAQLSHIRVEADEVTYDLHIMLRFDLEKRVVAGDLKVADIPAAWNEEFEKSFGLKVDDDADGCLQDIHWSMGAMGYFPTYSLGNLNASQLYRNALGSNGSIASDLESGNYESLLAWLRKNIHSQGRRLLPQDLMQSVTGEYTNPKYHLEHLRSRYL